jgi:tRNA uridine 5-carbamoylmethylation protein Kti12
MDKALYIIRGLPGCGKSTFANRLLVAGIVDSVFAADDYHDSHGGFDWRNLEAAHNWCQESVKTDLGSTFAKYSAHRSISVAVANTFVTKGSIRPYIDIAQNRSARVIVIDCYDGGMSDAELAAKNVHSVPEATIAKMRRQWESW